MICLLNDVAVQQAKLGSGFTADTPGAGSFAFFFSILVNDEIIGMITVWPVENGEYGYTMGQSSYADRFLHYI